MKKRRIVVAALVSCMAVSATFTGCSLVSTNNKADMAQVVAEVDISSKLDGDLAEYKSAISKTAIVKRDLVSYFLNVGYSYVNSYGYSYEETFNLLLDALIDNAVLVQYSTVNLLSKMAETNSDALETYLGYKDDVIGKYEYLLGGENNDDVLLAKYKYYSTINSAIDNYEKTIIDEENDYKGSDTRTTPTNLNTEQDDYFPSVTLDNGEKVLDYNIYTGYTGYLLKDSGAYKDEAIEGSTRATRIKAYTKFINNLRNNDLVDAEEEEDLADVINLEYMREEYITQLESRIVNRYYENYKDKQYEALNDYEYIQQVYNELVNSQKDSNKSAAAFESAMGNLSSTSFLLYSPDTSDSLFEDEGGYGEAYGRFGYVYNILLPFDAMQSVQLSKLKTVLSQTEDNDAYYYARNQLLQQIQTVDQREAWFNGSDNYSFKASESSITEYYKHSDVNVDYLFFEDNLTNSAEGGRYKPLQAYDGRYSYNGNVFENADGSYTLIGNKLNIDGMLGEFEAYIDYVLGNKNAVSFDNGYNPSNANTDFYNTKSFSQKNDEDEIDYSKFLYASGKVDLGTFNNTDLFNPETNQYKAMSAVNELQFAYTTDTGVLSQYVGYSVSAYDTSFIKEFEYASKLAISKGEGAFTVCAGDYGWHIIYVTYVFDSELTYGEEPNWDNIDVEGTFEYNFYEWIKSTDPLSNVTTKHRNKIVNDYSKEDETVFKYQSTYQNLLDLDK